MNHWKVAALAAAVAGVLSPLSEAATVYYNTAYKNWTTVNMHHNASGTWTTVPGTAMTAACAGWVVATVDSTATSFSAVFNNGAGAWDNPGNVSSANYAVPSTGIHQVKNGAITTNAGSPCGDTTAPSVPASLTSSNVTQTGATISWTASTDNVAVTGYEIYRNGVKIGTSATASSTGIRLPSARCPSTSTSRPKIRPSPVVT